MITKVLGAAATVAFLLAGAAVASAQSYGNAYAAPGYNPAPTSSYVYVPELGQARAQLVQPQAWQARHRRAPAPTVTDRRW